MSHLSQLPTKPIPRFFPLLSYCESLFQEVNLKNVLLIGVQHLYETTYSMFELLFALGLQPENLHIMGKCYSSDPDVIKRLEKKGVHISDFGSDFDSYEPYDSTFLRSIDKFIKKTFSEISISDFEKVIFLDDGGLLLDKAQEYMWGQNKIVGVEQTSAGYNRLSKKGVNIPIVNLARSWLKLKYETPIILDLFRRQLKTKLSKYQSCSKNLLVMGNGSIGNVVRDLFQSEFILHQFDKDPKKSSFSQSDLPNLLLSSDLILGCTGETSIPKSLHKYLKPGVILASLSSSDREFDAVYIRRRTLRTKYCHEDLEVDGVTLLNCGFPVNFGPNYREIDEDDFQLTRALTFCSICQAAKLSNKQCGFIPLDSELQNKILFKLLSLSSRKSDLVAMA